MPIISVIVPVYKVEKYIHRCVESILNQTFTDFELILVDDGSPDNCGAICDEYAEKDSRVVVIHQENGGLSAARNAGIDWAFANSNSEWLTFVDSDDWIHPQMLEKLLGAVRDSSAKISSCGYWEATEQTVYELVEDASYKLRTSNDFYMAYSISNVVAWGKLYHKSCFQHIRYPVGKIHEDEFVTYRIVYAQEYMAEIPIKLYFYFSNYEGITKRQWTPNRLNALEAFQLQIAFFKKTNRIEAEKRIIRKYRDNLLGQYEQYQYSKFQEKGLDHAFQSYARRYLGKYRREISTDTERDVHMLWIAFPKIACVYHNIKEKLKNRL